MKKKIMFMILLIMSLLFFMLTLEMGKTVLQNEGSSKEIINKTTEDTKAQSTVSAIVFDFRGYDTLGEAIVLFTAVCGTYTILRSNKTGGKKSE